MWNFNNTYGSIQQFMYGGSDGYDMADDPTYLTFSLDFIFDGMLYGGLGIYNSPLFISSGDVSAEIYLRNKNLLPQADRLVRFNSLLREVMIDYPWYFQSIKGLHKLWQNGSNMKNNFKAKDAILEITTLESYDLTVSYLADLYRKTVYDGLYMRELLPINLRHFEVDIYVAEFRHIKELELGGSFDISQTMQVNNDYFIKNASFFLFKCYQCEFDFGDSIPSDEYKVFGFDTPAANMFKIKVGSYIEQHQFSFYDIMTKEKFSQHMETDTDEWCRDPNMILNGVAGTVQVAQNAIANLAGGTLPGIKI